MRSWRARNAGQSIFSVNRGAAAKTDADKIEAAKPIRSEEMRRRIIGRWEMFVEGMLYRDGKLRDAIHDVGAAGLAAPHAWRGEVQF
jgi:hypothetical protein